MGPAVSEIEKEEREKTEEVAGGSGRRHQRRAAAWESRAMAKMGWRDPREEMGGGGDLGGSRCTGDGIKGASRVVPWESARIGTTTVRRDHRVIQHNWRWSKAVGL